MRDIFDSGSWSDLCALVTGCGIDLEALAKETGAIKRRRAVRDAPTVLRLALAYGSGLGSLDVVAAWAEQGGIAKLSKVALMKRLVNAADLLLAIAAKLLVQRAKIPVTSLGSRPLRLVDASCISKPGSVGTDWRLHAMYDPARQCFVEVELTDAKGGEGFERFAVVPGEIRIGDRGYISCRGLRHVLDGGGDFIIRAGWNALRLQHADGTPFDLIGALRQANRTGAERIDETILIEDRKHREPLKARLVAVRKSPEAAERERRDLRKNAQRRGKTPDPRTLEAADWILIVTSLHGVAAEEILALYRLRWQIELAFKRLKSLGDLDLLPARGAPRAWIAAKLIIATLIGHTTQDFLDSPPVQAASMAKHPPSVWRLFSLTLCRITDLIKHIERPPKHSCTDAAMLRHLCDTPRQRKKQLTFALTFR